jgi:capsular polysaccharide biosynthesis protein
VNSTPQTNYYEDEIDLKELWQTIVSQKLFIAIFTIVVTFLAVIYALSKPNEYESKTVLVVQEVGGSGAGSAGGNLGLLASMAGVNLSSAAEGISPAEGYTTLLNDYNFMKEFILNKGFHYRFLDPNLSDNYKFALGIDWVYRLFSYSSDDKENFDDLELAKQEAIIYGIVKNVQGILTISGGDLKTNLLTISAKHPDATLTKDLVEEFLKEASYYLKVNDMVENDRKILYYEEALSRATDVTLRTRLAELGSALIQKKVLANVNDFYNVKQLTKPEVAYQRDKAGPKRALIVLVAMVTGVILSIFIVFFREFLKNQEEQLEAK